MSEPTRVAMAGNKGRLGRFQGLRRRFLSLLGVVLLIALLFGGASILYFVFLTEQEAWQGRQEEAVNSASKTVVAFVQRVEDTLVLAGSLDRAQTAEQAQNIQTLLKRNTALLEIVRFDAKGQVVNSVYQDSPILASLFTASQSSWFLEAKAGKRYLGGIEISPDNEPYTIMALPAAANGVVAARVRMDVLWQVVADIKFGQTGTAYVVNRAGQIMAHTDQAIPLARTSIEGRPELAALLQAPNYEWRGSYTNFSGIPVVGLTTPVPETGWIVVAELPQTEAYRVTQNALSLVGGGLLIFALLVMLVTARLFERVIFGPIEKLREGAKRLGQGELNYRLNFGRQDEISQVAEAFNQMAETLQGLYGSLEQQVQDRTHRLEIVASLGQRLNSILKVEDLLVEVIAQIQANFGYYHAHIYLLDQEGQNLVVAEGAGAAGAEMKAKGHHIPLAAPASLVARAARTGQIVKVDNVRQASDWLPNPLLPNTQSEMAVPIVLKGQVAGVLDVQSDKVAGLDEGDANLLSALANQVAVALRNAHLFSEVETALAEARAAQARYLERAWEKTKITAQSGHYHFARPDAPALAQTVLAEAKQQAMAQSHTALLAVNGHDSKGKSTVEVQGQVESQRSIVAPITLHSVTIGSLQLHPAKPGQAWSEDDLAIVEAISEELAQTAENLRLFEETRQKASQEQTIREITDKLRAAPTLNRLLETAARELGQRLGARHTVLELGIQREGMYEQ